MLRLLSGLSFSSFFSFISFPSSFCVEVPLPTSGSMNEYARVTSYTCGKPEPDAQQVNAWSAISPSHSTTLHVKGDQKLTHFTVSTRFDNVNGYKDKKLKMASF
jgi:hypothetical protein